MFLKNGWNKAMLISFHRDKFGILEIKREAIQLALQVNAKCSLYICDNIGLWRWYMKG